MASCAALGPITATLDTAPASSGSSPSLTSSTVPAAATSRATDRRPGSSCSASSEGAGAPRIPTRSMSPSRRRTLSSTTASSTTPSRTAEASEGPSQADGPGISRSRPATAASRVEWVPNQSDTTSAVGAPLAPQHPVDQVGLLAAPDAVHLVVGRHDRPHPGLAHGGLEGRQMDLVQRPLVDLGRDRHPLVLLVVAGEVLNATGHPPGLHSAHVGDGQAGREERVLGEGLERPPGQRRPHKAYRRPQQHVDVLRAGLGGQHAAQPPDQLGVPGRPHGHAARQRQRAPADQ